MCIKMQRLFGFMAVGVNKYWRTIFFKGGKIEKVLYCSGYLEKKVGFKMGHWFVFRDIFG